MKNLFFVPLIIVLVSVVALAQPRPVDRAVIPTAAAKPAPVVFTEKYEGGLFGFTEKETGTLKFDDENERIVFMGKDQKERFGIPYKSLIVISPQSRSVTSNTGNVIRNIPLPGAGIAGAFIKEKRRYMLLQFNDPDADARGVTTFKVEDKALLDSVIETLGKKAKMTQRGDAYYRPRPVKTEI
ncbi:MAG: hypothetical protein ABIU09_09155 [Pyrinomonadaceae bacterium]